MKGKLMQELLKHTKGKDGMYLLNKYKSNKNILVVFFIELNSSIPGIAKIWFIR